LSFATITLCVASQRVFIVVSVYFVIDPVRKLLDTPSLIPLHQGQSGATRPTVILIRFPLNFLTVERNEKLEGRVPSNCRSNVCLYQTRCNRTGSHS